MSEEYLFKFEKKAEENLGELSIAGAELEERRICELSELAAEAAMSVKELYTDGMGILEILSLLSEELFIPEGEIHTGAMEESISVLRHYLTSLGALDKAIFAELLIKRLAEYGITVGERDFLSAQSIRESFVYVKNAYADEAYDVFSQAFSDPRVWYCKDFKEGLSKVSSEEVGYCLLPLEDHGARIQSVQELIFKGDFKISSVTPVFGFDGNADMKYCLVSKNYYYPEFSDEDDRYFEIRISKDSSLTGLLLAAESYGHGVYRVNSVNIGTDEGEKSYYSIILTDGRMGFLPLLVYILLFTDECTPIGIYKNIE